MTFLIFSYCFPSPWLGAFLVYHDKIIANNLHGFFILHLLLFLVLMHNHMKGSIVRCVGTFCKMLYMIDQGFKLRCRSLSQPAPGCIGGISVVHAVHAWLIWSGYSSKVTKNCKKSKNIIEHKESVQNKIRKQHLILQRCLVCLKANDAHDLMKLTETAIITH